MNKPTIGTIAVICMMSGFFQACGDKKSDKNSWEFTTLQLSKTEHLFADTAKPACNIALSCMYPVKCTRPELVDTLNAYITTACFGATYATQKPTDALAAYAKAYADNYRQETEPIYTDDRKEWYAYLENITGKVQLHTGNLLVYSIFKESYSGGAHGMYTTRFHNIDLTRLQPLHLDDIFTGDTYKERLTDLLWNRLMATNKVTTRKELEDMGYGSTGDLEPTENFYLTTDSITFYYNVYEVTPYAMGPTIITLPYTDMEGLLTLNTPLWKKLF